MPATDSQSNLIRLSVPPPKKGLPAERILLMNKRQILSFVEKMQGCVHGSSLLEADVDASPDRYASKKGIGPIFRLHNQSQQCCVHGSPQYKSFLIEADGSHRTAFTSSSRDMREKFGLALQTADDNSGT